MIDHRLKTQRTPLETQATNFLYDRRAQGLAPRSVDFYREKLEKFLDYAQGRGLGDILDISPTDLREFVLELARTHNPGGTHAFYRALRAFFLWYEGEYEPADWKNPIRKVKAPRLPEKVLDPVEPDTIQAMLSVCPKQSFLGSRDRAILLTLYDTGLRAVELTNLNLEDVDPVTGEILVRKGKGSKSRMVFIGKKTRTTLRTYLRYRPEEAVRLFVTQAGEGLTYQGLRFIIVRRAKQAGVSPPGLHAFRRANALAMLRSGTNLFIIQRLLGHSSVDVVKQYLKLQTDDLAESHRLGRGPADNYL